MLPRTVLFMIACAVVGYLLGRTRGMGLQGFFMGLAFGPLGWGLVLLWPTSWIQGPVPRRSTAGGPAHEPPRACARPEADDRASRARPPEADGACPRCLRPVPSDTGACPHCGNVLLPVRYRVNPG